MVIADFADDLAQDTSIEGMVGVTAEAESPCWTVTTAYRLFSLEGYPAADIEAAIEQIGQIASDLGSTSNKEGSIVAASVVDDSKQPPICVEGAQKHLSHFEYDICS